MRDTPTGAFLITLAAKESVGRTEFSKDVHIAGSSNGCKPRLIRSQMVAVDSLAGGGRVCNSKQYLKEAP